MTDDEIQDAALEVADALLSRGLPREAGRILDEFEKTCLSGLHDELRRLFHADGTSPIDGPAADRAQALRLASGPDSPVHARRAREWIVARRAFDAWRREQEARGRG